MTKIIHPGEVLRRRAEESFDIEGREDFAGMAEQLMDGHHSGVLTTVDGEGRPHVRWMGTLSFADFPRFYAITSPHSAKVKHILQNPAVEWMLSNQNLTLVLNLTGVAQILDDVPSLKRAWKAIEDKTRAFFLQSFNEKPGFVVIETNVERMTCTAPRSDAKRLVSIDSFRRCVVRSAAIETGVPPHCVDFDAEAKSMQVDEVLCQQVEQLATGADIHECSNLIGAYRAAIEGCRRGDGGMADIAREVTRTLRRKLTALRLIHYSRMRNE